MSKAISGAAARILIGGVTVGYATNVSATETIEQFPVQVLGEIDVQEFVPVARTVSAQADFIKLRLNSLTQQGIFPRGETLEVLNFPEMVWAIYDYAADVIIATLEGVVPESRTWRVSQGSIILTNASFRARRMLDEQES